MTDDKPVYHIPTQEITARLQEIIAASGKTFEEIEQWDLVNLPQREQTLPTSHLRVEGAVIVANGYGKKRHIRNPKLVYENPDIKPTTLAPDDVNYRPFIDREHVAMLTILDTLAKEAGVGGASSAQGIATNEEGESFFMRIPIDEKCRFGTHRAHITFLKKAAEILGSPEALETFAAKINHRLEHGPEWMTLETKRHLPNTMVTEFVFIEPPTRKRGR